jgi:catechol 2,3-dioxygenase-like lactoylglutathione lyase family enzyme
MIDHVVLNVRDLEASRAFYEKALAPLGWELISGFEGGAGFGVEGKPMLWIAAREPRHEGVHVALRAPDRGCVDAFHAAALAAGGTDHGPPGLREPYHPHYYGAFVLDPDGNNLEAVCHDPAG